MVSQGVVIGASSAVGTFGLLCIATIIYVLCCRSKSKTTGEQAENYKVASAPNYRIDAPDPPPLDLQVQTINSGDDCDGCDGDEGGNQDSHAAGLKKGHYPPLRTSITLPALSRTQLGNKPPHKRPLSQPSLDMHSTAIDEEPISGPDVPGPREHGASNSRLSQGRLRRLRSKDYSALQLSMDKGDEGENDFGDLVSFEKGFAKTLESLGGTQEQHAPYGQLQIKLEYITASCALRVHVLRAIGLPAMDIGGTSDPFVKVLLIDTLQITPAGKVLKIESSWKTKHESKTLNPEFDVHYDMMCPPSIPLQRLGILLQVYDYDRLSRNDIIGHAWVPLSDLDLTSIPTLWRALERGKQISTEEVSIALGEVEVAIGYKSQKRQLTVLIKYAKKLPKISLSKPPDPCAKVRLIYEDCKIGSKDFKPERNDQNPTFNKTAHFTLDADIPIEECVMTVSICHREGMTSIPIGIVNFGVSILTDQDASGQNHWNDIMQKPAGELVSKWHKLHSHVHAATYSKKKKRVTKSE
eukprot:scpid21975/ scgid0210/ Synaptotagmin-2; Synaptotagmin II